MLEMTISQIILIHSSHELLQLTKILEAKPLPKTKDVPFTIILIGPRNGADFFLIIFTPGTIPRCAKRIFAPCPALTPKTISSVPSSHSVRHLINGFECRIYPLFLWLLSNISIILLLFRLVRSEIEIVS